MKKTPTKPKAGKSATPKTLNVRQERFCEFIAAGESQTEAYINAGFKVPRADARKHAARLMTNDDVQARIAELRKPQTKATLRRKDDNLQFLSDLIGINPDAVGPDSIYCAEYTEEIVAGGSRGKLRRGASPSGNEVSGPEILRRKVKLPCKLRAIEIYSKLLGHFEPDRVEVDAGPKTLLSIKERAHQVCSALVRKYTPSA